MGYVGPVVLAPEERSLFDGVRWSPRDHDDYLHNAERVPKLVKALLARRAIPEHRVEYFINPEYRNGRSNGSHRDIFEGNGTRGDDILKHAHFLKFFRYLVLGADLPSDVVAEFSARAKRLAPVTSDDVEELWELARKLVNAKRIEPSVAAEEFFKLSLDSGVHVMHAKHIRDVVRRMRLRKAA